MSQYGAAEYLGHQLLLTHQEQRGLVPKTVFYKLWCISDRYLMDNYGLDIVLPRYWYMYGEMVDEQSVDTGFRTAPGSPWGGQAYKPVWDLEPTEFDVTEQEREFIDNTVKWTANRFERKETQYLESYQYQSYAPNNFIRSYSELRAHLQYVNLETQEVLTPLAVRPEFDADGNKELIEAYLDELVITYPEHESEFADLQALFLRWEDTVRLLLDQPEPYEEIAGLLDEFIEALSKAVLQLKYNDDIPETRLEEWRKVADNARERFESNLAETRKSLLLREDPHGELDGVSEAYDELVLSNAIS